jgi:hypothetical protein
MAFKKIKDVPPTVSVLFIGDTGTGKTYPMFQMPGPLGVFDGEAGTKAYQSKFDFGVDFWDEFEELTDKVQALIDNPEELKEVTTVGFDGMTVAWHQALREIEDPQGRIGFNKQAQLKAHGKLFMAQVMGLSKRGKNVVANVQAKPEWDTTGPSPKLVGFKGDVDERIWFAFDLVITLSVERDAQGNEVRYADVLKSRFPDLVRVGDRIPNFDAAEAFRPIFEGKVQPSVVAEEDGTVIEMQRAKGKLEAELRRLKSVKNGGVVPDDLAGRIYKLSQSAEATMDQVAAGLRKLKEIEAAATSAPPAAPPPWCSRVSAGQRRGPWGGTIRSASRSRAAGRSR